MRNTKKPRAEILVYKEIGPGDMRKMLAQSNDSPSGGGARDLRLPWRTFRPVMHRLFTEDAIGKGGRQIRTANVTYKTTEGRLSQTVLEYWPATDARPAEDRVSKIHASPALGGYLPAQNKGRVFLLFIRWNTAEVRCYYAYEDDLRTPGVWGVDVRTAILGCMADTDLKNATRKSSPLSVQGYYDFLDGTVFCHANG